MKSTMKNTMMNTNASNAMKNATNTHANTIKTMLKKLLGIITICGILSLTACAGETASGESASTEPANKLEQIKQSGKLVVGTSADYPPYEFHAMIDGKDQIVGFDIEIAKKIAEHLGVELEVQDMAFDAVLAGVDTGLIDIGVAGINKSDERDEVMDFSEMYYSAENIILTKADSENNYTTLDELDGKTIGVQMGTLQDDFAKAEFTNSTVKSLGKITDLVLELKTGMIDAILLEAPVARAYAAQNPDLKLGEMTFLKEEGGAYITTANDEPELMAEINLVIKELLDSGQLDLLVQQATELAEQQAEQ